MDSADELVQEGIRLAAAGRRKEALALFKRAVEEEPRSQAAWLWLAELVEDDEERIKCLENVVHINPKNRGALERLANLRERDARMVPPGVDDSAVQAPAKAAVSPGEPSEEAAVIECWRCGFHNLADNIFCGRCGAGLTEPKQEPGWPEAAEPMGPEARAEPASVALDQQDEPTDVTATEPSEEEGEATHVRCSQCGTYNQRDSRFCRECGARVGAAVDHDSAADAGAAWATWISGADDPEGSLSSSVTGSDDAVGHVVHPGRSSVKGSATASGAADKGSLKINTTGIKVGVFLLVCAAAFMGYINTFEGILICLATVAFCEIIKRVK